MTILKYFGVSAVQITTSGKRIVIDPYLLKSPIKPVRLEDVEADVILVTHGARDHFGDAVELAKMTGALLVGCIDVLTCARKKGVPEERTISMVPGAQRRILGIDVKALHVQHISFSRCDDVVYTGVPLSYLIKLEEGVTLYHAGDSALHGDYKLFGEVYRPDIAMMPIGMFPGAMTEMEPWESAIATDWLNVKLAIPVHYDPVEQADYPQIYAQEVAKRNPHIKTVPMDAGTTYKLRLQGQEIHLDS